MALAHIPMEKLITVLILIFASLSESEPRVKSSSSEPRVNITHFLETMESLSEAHFFTQQAQVDKVSAGTVSDSISVSADPGSSANSLGMNNSMVVAKYPTLSSLTPIELRNRTHNYSTKDRRSKRQFAGLALAAARYIPKFLVKTVGPIFSTLLGSGKSHIASKWAKNLVPHTAIANSDAHDSIRHHIQSQNGHQILNILDAHSKDWDPKRVYPALENGEQQLCRRNVPIFDKVLQQRLGTAFLASNTLVSTLVNHLTETLNVKFEKAAVKLDSLSNTTDLVSGYVATAMAPVERYVMYGVIGVLGIFSIVILVWCHRLESALVNLAMHLEDKETKMKELLKQTIQDQAKVVQDSLVRKPELSKGRYGGARSSLRLSNYQAIPFDDTSL